MFAGVCVHRLHGKARSQRNFTAFCLLTRFLSSGFSCVRFFFHIIDIRTCRGLRCQAHDRSSLNLAVPKCRTAAWLCLMLYLDDEELSAGSDFAPLLVADCSLCALLLLSAILTNDPSKSPTYVGQQLVMLLTRGSTTPVAIIALKQKMHFRSNLKVPVRSLW